MNPYLCICVYVCAHALAEATQQRRSAVLIRHARSRGGWLAIHQKSLTPEVAPVSTSAIFSSYSTRGFIIILINVRWVCIGDNSGLQNRRTVEKGLKIVPALLLSGYGKNQTGSPPIETVPWAGCQNSHLQVTELLVARSQCDAPRHPAVEQ